MVANSVEREREKGKKSWPAVELTDGRGQHFETSAAALAETAHAATWRRKSAPHRPAATHKGIRKAEPNTHTHTHTRKKESCSSHSPRSLVSCRGRHTITKKNGEKNQHTHTHTDTKEEADKVTTTNERGRKCGEFVSLGLRRK